MLGKNLSGIFKALRGGLPETFSCPPQRLERCHHRSCSMRSFESPKWLQSLASCASSSVQAMENHNSRRNHFVRNGEGTSSVRLRRRKDQVGNPNDYSKKRNRHSGDFYQWNPNNIVIPVNRFSMFESRFIDENRMETLDRRMPENADQNVWVPMLSRPPISGTGHRVLESKFNNRRSCDLSNSTGVLLDNDDVRTDVNRNISDKLRSKANKKYHKKVSKYSFKHRIVAFTKNICMLFYCWFITWIRLLML